MKIKQGNIIGISSFALSIILASCSIPNVSSNIQNNQKTEISSEHKFNTSLTGKVDFGNRFNIKAVLNDVAKNATVSLIYPSDNTSGNANKTIATGLTNDSGIFKINPDTSFSPNTGDIFILNASKRLGGPGNSLISVQTFVRWNGAGWDSITYPNILLNSKTTAVTIISSYNSTSTPSSSTIQKLQVSNGIVQVSNVNNTDATANLISDVASLVNNVISDGQDPVANIYKQNGVYNINYFVSSSTQERAIFNGKVYDPSGNALSGVTVNAYSLDPGVNWVGEPQETVDGVYIFRNAPVGVRIAIEASRDGYTTRSRTEVVKSNLNGDPLANVFDFSGINSVQDEPEITSLKINGSLVTSSVSGDMIVNDLPSISKPALISQLTSSTYNPALTGITSNTLTVDLSFSEPVRHDDVENYLRVRSQVTNGSSFTIDQNLAGMTFTWSGDDKSVTMRTNKAILSNKTGDEFRYILDFSQPFRDKTDKYSISQKYFRFSSTQTNDFAVFSVLNDTQAPALYSILANDGGLSTDTIEFRFSEAMELINSVSAAIGLADPASPADTTRQLYAYNTNVVSASKNTNGPNNVTLLGYKNSSGNFVISYSIGRITSSDLNSKTPHLTALKGFPTTLTQYGSYDTYGYLLRSARVTGNSAVLSLTPQAFDVGDKLVIAVGSSVSGNYYDRTNNVGPFDLSPDNLNLPVGATFATVTDPAGNLLDSGNSTTSSNIDVNNKQRVSTVN